VTYDYLLLIVKFIASVTV